VDEVRHGKRTEQPQQAKRVRAVRWRLRMRVGRGMQMDMTVAVRTRNMGESEWRTGESEWSTRSEACEWTNARFFPAPYFKTFL
jgi:hypothetical protein